MKRGLLMSRTKNVCLLVICFVTNYCFAKNNPTKTLSITDIQRLHKQAHTEPYKPVTRWCLYLHGLCHGLTFDVWHSNFRAPLTPECRALAHAARVVGKATTITIMSLPFAYGTVVALGKYLS